MSELKSNRHLTWSVRVQAPGSDCESPVFRYGGLSCRLLLRSRGREGLDLMLDMAETAGQLQSSGPFKVCCFAEVGGNKGPFGLTVTRFPRPDVASNRMCVWTALDSYSVECGTDVLSTGCEFRFFVILDDSSADLEFVEGNAGSSQADLEALSSDLGRLLTTDVEFADVQLKCGEVTLSAHKCILSCRSQELRDRISSASDDVTVEVDQSDPFTLAAFLEYLYTGKLPEDRDTLVRLCSLGRQ